MHHRLRPMMTLPGGKICNESPSMIQARIWYRANRASSESKSRDSGNPHHAHLGGNMSHPRTNIIENDSPHYASYESSSRTESSSSGMTATVLTSVFSRYFSAKSNVVDTIATPFLTCEPLTWHRRAPCRRHPPSKHVAGRDTRPRTYEKSMARSTDALKTRRYRPSSGSWARYGRRPVPRYQSRIASYPGSAW